MRAPGGRHGHPTRPSGGDRTRPPAGPLRAILLRAAALLALLVLAAAPAQGQDAPPPADSSAAAPPDTVAAVLPDTAAVREDGPLVPLGAHLPGRAVGGAPVSAAALDAPALLARRAASFHLDPGTPGGASGWSPEAIGPDAVGLRLGGRTLDDGVTGRPRWDLLPLELLAPLHAADGGPDAPMTVHAAVRALVAADPYTELRYRSGGGGLQSITGLHTQNRRRTLLGQAGLLGALFAYADRTADGEYPGSRTRTRHLALRLRFYGPRWSAEVAELNTLHRAGAHGGVLPFAGVFGTVYNRFDPTVRNPDARRRTRRNDLSATFRRRHGADAFTTLTAYWTRLSFRFTDPDRAAAWDTLGVRTHRVGAAAEATRTLGRHRLSARLDGRLDAHTPDAALGVDAPLRPVVQATLADSLRLGRADVLAQAGLSAAGGAVRPAFVVGGRVPAGPLALTALVAHGGTDAAFAGRYGFGPYLTAAPEAGSAAWTRGRFGASARRGVLEVEAFVFAHADAAPLLLVRGELDEYGIAAPDSVEAVVPGTAARYAGGGLDVGWRRDAGRGLYARVQPTAAVLLDPGASDAHARLDAALPRLWVRARVGARLRLFRGDLALDAYAEGVAWSAFRGRTLHPATGRYALPPADGRVYGPSGRLDLVAEAGVRGAVIFLAWENALSGTVLTPGNLVVPVHPLPDRRFRFGVYWPILD